MIFLNCSYLKLAKEVINIQIFMKFIALQPSKSSISPQLLSVKGLKQLDWILFLIVKIHCDIIYFILVDSPN